MKNPIQIGHYYRRKQSQETQNEIPPLYLVQKELPSEENKKLLSLKIIGSTEIIVDEQTFQEEFYYYNP